jgi:hypothetical protein
MDAIQDAVRTAVGDFLGRASGPMHLRLILQPIIAAFLAIKAMKRDADAGEPPFLWELFTRPDQRARLVESAWRDIGKIFIVAIVLDTAYQFLVLRSFHIVQTLIVGIVLAILPYLLVRGPVARLVRGRGRGPGR